MLVSYFWGQKVYPIPYQVGRIIIYFIVALGIFFLSHLFTDLPLVWRLLINTALILVYCAVAFIGERTNPLKIK
ncbi:MAG: lipopolysaccharide biosynthesis protein, partial [Bacteroidales bacterium]|nr:lipopolysaccharide biosynthesis protein [Bacteroidales bacterium]